jgi:major type 1 subunit fimbrin (pilin)
MNKITLLTLMAAVGMTSLAAYAEPSGNGGTITFYGKAIPPTCEVNPGSSGSFSVALPSISTKSLSTAGATAGATGFTISLTSCATDGTRVRTMWEYGRTTSASGTLKNDGTATGIEIQLVDWNSGSPNVMDLSKADGAQNSQSVALVNGEANLRYAAQYYSPTGNTTGGSIETSVQYSLTYE